MKKSPLTAIVLTYNEAEMIGACLDCLQWCQEIWVIDRQSIDQTVTIAKQHGAQIQQTKLSSFAQVRTSALQLVKTPWVLYIDADERVTPELAKEISQSLNDPQVSALQLQRTNVFYGTAMSAGGWHQDRLHRVFRVDSLSAWQGEVHESPIWQGKARLLTQPLVHLSHRSTIDGLQKTTMWTPIEARHLLSTGQPIHFWTILRKGVMEFIRRAILWRGFRDGEPGLIEALIQGINRALVYIQVWEQQQPSIKNKYQVWEDKIARSWRQISSK